MPPQSPILPYPTRLSFLESLDYIWKLLRALGAGTWAALAYPFHNDDPKPFRSQASHAFLRSLTRSLTVRQIQTSTTAASYDKFARATRIVPCKASWGETGQGCWVGQKSASYVLVWFHGGNYYSPAHPAYLDFLAGIVDACCRAGMELAVFVPLYTLAPHAKYPCQLREGLDALRYLVEEKDASHIILGGDSAGGNLVLGILSHLSHPHPDLAQGPSIKGNLGGAILMSPWVTFDQSWHSITRNINRDCVSLVSSSLSAKYWLGNRHLDNYNEPLRAPADWWADIKARRVLFIAGDDDLMVDSHLAFAAKFRRSNPHNTQVVSAPGEGHIAPILNLILGDHSEFESTKAIKTWLLSLVH